MAMTSKEIARKTIEQLPESASWEDIQERINFIVGVRKGLCEQHAWVENPPYNLCVLRGSV